MLKLDSVCLWIYLIGFCLLCGKHPMTGSSEFSPFCLITCLGCWEHFCVQSPILEQLPWLGPGF